MPATIEYCKLHLVPQITKKKMAKFPFSYEFFAQCMHNFVTREEHFLRDENLDLPSLFASKINFLILSKRYKYNK